VAVVVAVCLAALIGLPVIAFAAQVWAKRRTFPCPHCREFIPKATVRCPRCGKTLEPPEPLEAKGP
jgi:predicted amidophosphoribosyltransferase